MSATSLREKNISEVIEHELTLFLFVKNEGGTAACQENPDMFRHWRWMVFSVLSDKYIESYLQDLMEAAHEGRNLLLEKYARMSNLIPCVSPNMDKVHAIAAAERVWMEALAQEFPLQFSQQLKRFDFYFTPEIETLSERTLDCYLACIASAQQEGRNLAKERYENMHSRLGLATLAEKEAQLRQSQG